MTPVFLLVGLYLATRDVPDQAYPAHMGLWGNLTQPVPEAQPTPKVLDPPRRQVPTDPTKSVTGVKFPDYWTFYDRWEQMKANNTTLAFKNWADWQTQKRFLLTGVVRDVDDTFGNACSVAVRRVEENEVFRNNYDAFDVDCSKAEHLKYRAPVEAVCTVGGRDFFNDPSLEDCEIVPERRKP